jgi:hypothetical protein
LASSLFQQQDFASEPTFFQPLSTLLCGATDLTTPQYLFIGKNMKTKSARIFVVVVLLTSFLFFCVQQDDQNWLDGTRSIPTMVPPKLTMNSITFQEIAQWTLPVPDIYDVVWKNDGGVFFINTTVDVEAYKLNSDNPYWLWVKGENAPADDYSAIEIGFDGRLLYLYSAYNGIIAVDPENGREVLNSNTDPQFDACTRLDSSNSIITKDNKLILDFMRTDPLYKGTQYAVLNVWDLSSMQCMKELEKVEGYPGSLSLSPDGTVFAWNVVSKYDQKNIRLYGKVFFFDVSADRKTCTIEGSANVFSPVKDQVIIYEPDSNMLSSWNYRTCQRVGDIKTIGNVLRLAISPNGKWLGVLNEANVLIVDPNTGFVLETLNRPLVSSLPGTSNYGRIIFDPTNSYLIFVGSENVRTRIILWKIH